MIDTPATMKTEPELEGPATVVVIEDDHDMRDLIQKSLQEKGFRVVALSNGKQMLDYMMGIIAGTIRVKPAVIVSDVQMPGMTGVEILSALRNGGVDVPVILMTGYVDPQIMAAADRLNAVHTFFKPFRTSEMVSAVWRLVYGSALPASDGV